MLDLLITRLSDSTSSGVHIHDAGLSAHYAVHCVLPLSKPPREVKTIVCRKLCGIDMESFSNDLQSVLAKAPVNNLSEITEHYNNALRQVLDKHAPEKSKVITIRPAAPWYSEEIAECKKLRRKLERHWRKTKCPDDYDAYAVQCRRMQLLLSSSKADYYVTVIDQNCVTRRSCSIQWITYFATLVTESKLPDLLPDELPDKVASFFTYVEISLPMLIFHLQWCLQYFLLSWSLILSLSLMLRS